MKYSVVIFAGVAAAVANVYPRFATTCDADDCARQVSITRFGPATQTMRFDDCSTNLATTVISRVGGSASTITPTAVPDYASSCTVGGTSDYARYSSACALCNGVGGSTTTVVLGCNADLCSRGLFGTNIPTASVASNSAACTAFFAGAPIASAATASCTAIGERSPSQRFSSACVCAGATPGANPDKI